jgi:hypothetical protein
MSYIGRFNSVPSVMDERRIENIKDWVFIASLVALVVIVGSAGATVAVTGQISRQLVITANPFSGGNFYASVPTELVGLRMFVGNNFGNIYTNDGYGSVSLYDSNDVLIATSSVTFLPNATLTGGGGWFDFTFNHVVHLLAGYEMKYRLFLTDFMPSGSIAGYGDGSSWYSGALSCSSSGGSTTTFPCTVSDKVGAGLILLTGWETTTGLGRSSIQSNPVNFAGVWMVLNDLNNNGRVGHFNVNIDVSTSSSFTDVQVGAHSDSIASGTMAIPNIYPFNPFTTYYARTILSWFDESRADVTVVDTSPPFSWSTGSILMTSSSFVGISWPHNTTLEFDFYKVQYTAPNTGQHRIEVISATSTANLSLASTNNQKAYADVAGERLNQTTFVYRAGTDSFCQSENVCPAPTGMVWYAKAYLFSSDGSLLSVSLPITLNVLFSFKNIPTPLFLTPLTSSTPPELFPLSVCPSDYTLGIPSVPTAVCGVSNGFKSFLNYLAESMTTATAKLGALIQKVFPLNIYAHIDHDFKNYVRATSTDLSFNVGGQTQTFVTSTTLDSMSTRLGFNYKTIIDYILYAMTGIMLIVGTVVLFMVMSKMQNK